MTTTARPEPFDSPLILSPSTNERLAQDVLVEGRSIVLVVRQAHHERVIRVDDESDDDVEDDEDDFSDPDEEEDGDEDQDDDEDDVETWQVRERPGGFPLKLDPGLTSSPELPRLPMIFQLSQLDTRPI